MKFNKKFNKKGQAALEFLTTYGWAFLVILVMIGGLSYFGVFDFSKGLKESCSVTGKFQCSETFLVQNTATNAVQIELKNDNSKKITITEFKIIEKSLAESATAVTWATDTNIDATAANSIEIAPGAFTLVGVNLDATGLTNSGIEDNVGEKKIFLYEFTYTTVGSDIVKSASGEITTTVE